MSTPSANQPQPSLPDSIIIAAIGLLLAAVYLATPALYPRGLDEMNAFSVGRSVQGHGSFDVDSLGWTGPISGVNAATVVGVDGHTYTPEDVAASVIAMPFIKLGYLAGVSPIHAAHLSTILITILTAVMMYMIARAWGYARPTRILAMLAFGLATQAWPFATSLMNNVTTALGLSIAVWGVTVGHAENRWRAALIGGLGMSLAGLSNIAAWALLPLFIVYIVPWEDFRKNGFSAAVKDCWPVVIAFGAGAAIGLATGAVYNITRYGSPFETGMAESGNLDFRLEYLPVGLFGLLLSTPIGLVWFAPAVLLAPIGAVMAIRMGHARRTVLLLGLIAVFLLLYGSYFLWWAATLWGPRYLIPVGPCFVLLALPVLDRVAHRIGPAWARMLMAIVLVFSALTQLAVTTLDYAYVSQRTHNLITKYTPPVGFSTELPFLTDLRLLPYPQAISIAAEGHWAVLWGGGGQIDWGMVVAGVLLIGLAGAWLWLASRRPDTKYLRGALIGQVALSIIFAGALLARYPHSGVPFELEPPEMTGAEAAIDYIKSQAGPDDGVVTLLYPTESYAWHDYFDSSIPDIGLTIQPQLDANAQIKLDKLPKWRKRIWLVSNATAGGNPDNAVEKTLAMRGYIGPETWYDNWRVVMYTLTTSTEDALGYSGTLFGDEGLTLEHYLVTPSRGWIDVRLDWKTEYPLATSYVVFVHLLDSSGQVVAQHDGIPAAGYAPTNSWAPGPVINDRHALLLPPDLPPGQYTLTVGMYDPATGERLAVSTGGDAVTLDTITLPITISP